MALCAAGLAATAAAAPTALPSAQKGVACFKRAGWQAGVVGRAASGETFVLAVHGSDARLRALAIVLQRSTAQAIAVAREAASRPPRAPIYRAGRVTYGCHGATPQDPVRCSLRERTLAQRCLGSL